MCNARGPNPMSLAIISALFLGIFLGIFTGILPGFHINLLATLLLSISAFLLIYFSPFTLSIFIISIAITHIFLDSLPSTFLGAPNEDYALASLPAHALLLQGNAYQAVIYITIGALSSIAIFAILSPLLIPFSQFLYPLISKFIPYILIAASTFIILKERNKLLALLIFLLSGTLGLSILNTPINQPLLPLLSGLFGVSILILSIRNKPIIPPQKTDFPEINKKQFAKAALSGFLSSIFLGFLPAITSSQSSTIAASFQKLKRNAFLILTGFTSASFAMLSIIALFSISKTRAGFLVVISQLLEKINFQQTATFILTALITASLAALITIKLAKYFSGIINKLNYQFICIIALLFIITLTTIISGFIGLLILATAASLGIIPQLNRISKLTLIGSLILPTILFFLL